MKKFVEYMNTKHANIKFTFEYENNNSFSFLDVKICRKKNKLTISVYKKPTFSRVFTNFKNFIPTVYKFGLVYTLLHRCFNITSSYEKFHNEINALKQILKLNRYPTQFIDRCIKQFLQKLYVTKAIQDTVNKKQLLIVLSFLGVQSFLVDTVHNFIKEDLKELLKFASYESFFTFDNEYYSQLDGVAMGSPLGPTLANAFLCHFEKQWLSDCPQDFFPNIYRRYVDDIFVTFNSYMSN